jgi:hypothetical protein
MSASVTRLPETVRSIWSGRRTMALADRARFVLSCYVVVEISSLGWRGHQRIVHWRRYVKIAGDGPALKLYLEHMSDGVVCNRFQTRGGNELSSHGIKVTLGEGTVSSLKCSWESLCRCCARLLGLERRMKLSEVVHRRCNSC